MEVIESFTCLANLYEDVRATGKDAYWMSSFDFGNLWNRTPPEILMIDGKLTALRGLDYDGIYIQILVDGRLVTFRPLREPNDPRTSK